MPNSCRHLRFSQNTQINRREVANTSRVEWELISKIRCADCGQEFEYVGNNKLRIRPVIPAEHRKPSLTKQALNLTKAVKDFVADGCQTVDAATYKARLDVCNKCDYRDGKRCTVCGCFVDIKAKMSSQHCPEGLWDNGANPTPKTQSVPDTFVTTIDHLPTRNHLPTLLNKRHLLGEGVEVGVFEAEYSEHLLTYWRGKRLHLVDTNILDEARNRVDEHRGRAILHQMSSVGAAKQFENNTLDFVYIDADHRYDVVVEDLRAWWPKVRPGGVFAGHDYLNSDNEPKMFHNPVPLENQPEDPRSLPFAVKAAVDEFVAEHGLELHTTGKAEKRSASWWLVKPYRFVTAVDEAYLPAILALAQSMKENAKIPVRFTAMLYGPLSDKSRDKILSVGVPFDFIELNELGKFEFPREWTFTPRMTPNFNKPLIWLLPFDHMVCYIDSDVLCLNSLVGMHAFESLSVVPMQSSIRLGPDCDDAYRPSGMVPWNAGIMWFKPDPEVFDGLQRHARSYDGPIKYGDQVIHNDYFAEWRRDDVHYLESNWNMSTWVSQKYPDMFDQTKVRLLHFAHNAKPWSDEPSHEWMHRWWAVWQEYYNRAIL